MKKTIVIVLGTLGMFSVNADSWVDSKTGIEWEYHIEDGGVMVDASSKSSGSLSIPALIDDIPVVAIGSCAFEDCSGLSKIEIPSGVTNICDWAFGGCCGLTSVTLPDMLTSIGNSAFYCCCGLKSLNIPEGVTDIGECAFAECSALTSLMLPSSVTVLGAWAFDGCSGLKSVAVPGAAAWDSGLDFASLTELVITEGTESIDEGAFSECENLIALTIPSSVTNVGESAFENTHSLKRVTLPGWDCNLDLEGVTELTISEGTMQIQSGAFTGGGGCCGISSSKGTPPTRLTSIKIPSSVISIGSYAFPCSNFYRNGIAIVDGCVLAVDEEECPQNVVLLKGVRLICDSAFSYCYRLQTITLPEGLEVFSMTARTES